MPETSTPCVLVVADPGRVAELTDALSGEPLPQGAIEVVSSTGGDDTIELFAKSGTTYTPTLLVQYGGPWAENWWYERNDILADPKLTKFTPFSELERRGLRRPQWFRENEYSFKLYAEQAKKVVEAGGRVGVGSHGQLQGLGYHW